MITVAIIVATMLRVHAIITPTHHFIVLVPFSSILLDKFLSRFIIVFSTLWNSEDTVSLNASRSFEASTRVVLIASLTSDKPFPMSKNIFFSSLVSVVDSFIIL